MAIWSKLMDRVVANEEYYLMHEDYELAKFSVRNNEIGKVEIFSEKETLRRLPFIVLYSDTKADNLRKWIRDRAKTFELIDKDEEDSAIDKSFVYMLDSLGLSLSDHYWFKPLDEHMFKWKMVNCYEHDFVEEVDDVDYAARKFTPNTTLGGDLYKRWKLVDGKRILVKSDFDDDGLSAYFEVFISQIHKLQGKFKHTSYGLIDIDLNDEVTVKGCQCYAFTSKDKELLTMDGLTYIKDYDNYDMYERVIELSKKFFNLDIRKFLEYQIMVDFLTTNIDRDFTNFGFLRDSHDLRALGVAPIYDSGNSFGLGLDDMIDLNRIETNSFFYYEAEGLTKVKNYDLIDITKLPSVDNFYRLLLKAPIAEQKRLAIVQLYQEKIRLLAEFQNGRKTSRRRG